MKKILNYLRPILIIILLYYLYTKVDFEILISEIDRIKLFYLIVPCIGWVITIYLSSVRWWIILDKLGLKIKLNEAFKLCWIGSFFSNFLPSTIGGDTYKITSLKKTHKLGLKQLIMSIAMDRGVGLFVTAFYAFISGVGLVITFSNYPSVLLVVWITLSPLLFAIVYFLIKTLVSKSSMNKFRGINELAKILNKLFDIKDHKKLLTQLILISIVINLIVTVSSLSIFYALNYSPSILTVAFVFSFLQIVSIIPISFNALGVKESMGVIVLNFFGFDSTVSLIVLIISRALSILCTASGGLVYLFTSNHVKDN